MRRYSITDKFIIASFVISMIIIVIVASYSFLKAKHAILDRTFSQLNSVRYIKTELLESFFDNCKNDIRLATNSTDIQILAKQINTQSVLKKYGFVQAEKNIQSDFYKKLSHTYYKAIYLITTNKNVLFIKPYKSGYSASYIKEVVKGFDTIPPLVWTDYQSLRAGLKPVSTYNPIIDKTGQKLGVLVFEINPKAIDTIMLNRRQDSGLGRSGESYLVGADRLMRSSSRFTKQSVLQTTVQTKAVKTAFTRHASSKIVKDYRGVPVLSSFGKINIPNLNWVLLAEIDYKEATIPIFKIRYEIIFISIFIFLVVLIIVIVLSKKITQPIEKLNEAVHKISQGDLDVKLHYKNDDEIGELTHTFNLMTKELKHKNKELESERIKSLRSLIDGQEIERQRLSRELHDSLGQLLIALKLKYEASTDREELGELFDKTIEETRRISNNLMPSALEEFGLATAIRNVCNDISENTNIQVELTTKGNLKTLDLETKIYLFRIIQEALTNILKHAQASKLSLLISQSTKNIKLSISDNGIGYNPQENPKKNSNGINNIKDRVSLLQGTIEIVSHKNKGTHIHIHIPIRK